MTSKPFPKGIPFLLSNEVWGAPEITAQNKLYLDIKRKM
jgi:hypothetical protein